MSGHWCCEADTKLRALYRIQDEIASKAVIADAINRKELKTIAGTDQTFFYGLQAEEMIVSAIVVLEYPSQKFINYSYSMMPVDFPYISGLLSFREAPAILNTFYALKNKPDLLIINRCGINHPRFAGLATYVGVILNVATIGVTKSSLCGSGEVPREEGEANVIKYQDRAVGYYLKSEKGSKPIIVAPGHKVSLETSLTIIKSCIRKHKLPEPTRIAHLCANKIKKQIPYLYI
uniref:Endonuclease V n=1 Tax=Uncultured archaeon GZfos26G2 TaxID=3386331 RepID=A0A7H0XS19_UNCAG|nr:Endonuclease V [uncultured archaeon GZfos22D9]